MAEGVMAPKCEVQQPGTEGVQGRDGCLRTPTGLVVGRAKTGVPVGVPPLCQLCEFATCPLSFAPASRNGPDRAGVLHVRA
jgi:hypothetical protein